MCSFVESPVSRRMSGSVARICLREAAGHLQRVGDVVVHRARRQQLEVLEDDADVAAVVGHLLVLDLVQIAARDADAPVGRVELLDQQAHDRRLARARRADEEDHLLAAHRERRALQADAAGAVELRHTAELDDRVARVMQRRSDATGRHLHGRVLAAAALAPGRRHVSRAPVPTLRDHVLGRRHGP